MAKYLLAGGGTGGHLYPGLAVAEAIAESDSSAKIAFAFTSRPIDQRILQDWTGEKLVQPIQPICFCPKGLIRFVDGWYRSKRMLRTWLKENKPAAVLGLGGFGSGAAVYEAHRLGIKTACLQPDFVPGRANQWLGKYSEKIFVQWEGTREFFKQPVEVVGVPLRKDIRQLPDRAEGMAGLGLDPARKTLVVTGGSTGAKSLNQAVIRTLAEIADRVDDDWQVLHITGSNDFDRIKTIYQLAGKAAKHVTALEYCDRMDWVWAVADLAICRAGAITLAELTAAKVPSILLPYPYHRDQHQAKNAQVLVEAGAAMVVEDDRVSGEQTVGELYDALQKILSDDTIRAKMVEGAGRLRRADAAEKVARWMTEA